MPVRPVAPTRLEDAPAGSLTGGQTVCLSAIFREDDPRVVERCLRSVRPFLTSWAVVDTGSSDAVKATVRRVLAGIPGELVEREWPDDFAMARNWALGLARKSGATWAMFLDADDYVEQATPGAGLPPLAAFREVEQATFPSVAGNVTYNRTTFARLDVSGLEWRHRVHEQLYPYPRAMGVQENYRVCVTSEGAQSRRPGFAKEKEYQRLLSLDVESNPDDLRSRFMLANSFFEEKDYAAAFVQADAFLARIADANAPVFTTPRYLATVMRATSAAALGRGTDEIVEALEHAYAECPDRAEAPRVLARILRTRGERLDLAAQLDAEADTKTAPDPVSGLLVDANAYSRSASSPQASP